ncbi:hypothetical protein GLAREA_04325 [Glarea lozoyensis ATCC 20868]|uniref:Uncharacterized protein n=2 Tax=Glarea lozoyensis TaxID=101852 RepID=S3CQZ1_GLAL2|nr:uncharacterized protein GLAREA_04325 [Glarea lozoyensis ATCC 20868]EHL01812.1 hypothetical protein M7I_2164 [Glarea lozoyensis 74030]EPE27534.1 hypothetical protein GLAREA_04325 [Glarea lozoyensis ATCC 20868]
MHPSRYLALFAAFSGAVIAQNDDDNDNDSNTTSTTLGPRESAVTIVETSYEVITSTNVDSSVYITSLPKSLFTRTTQVAVDTTLVPVLTPSVISAASTYVVTTRTGANGEAVVSTVIPTGATVVSSGDRVTVVPTGATATSTGGAYATYIPGGVGLIALGFAALL